VKAWQAIQWCEPEDMQLRDVATPEPGPTQVRIRNRAASVNFFDLLQIQGKYQVKPLLPFTPGAEVSGIVDAVGSSVKKLHEGDGVVALTYAGGYSEYSIAESYRTFPIPDGMEFKEAAAMPIVYHTSWFALNARAALKEREWLLVHAGASGVGMAAIQLGKALGARVIATAGQKEKLTFALAQGADHAIDYSNPSWVDRVKEITERSGANVVFDPVGGDVFDLSLKCLAAEGRLLIVGFAGGRIPNIAANRVLLKNVSVVGVLWGDYAAARPWYMDETQHVLEQMFAEKKIRPAVTKTYGLSAAPEAMRDIANRQVLGKIVLLMDEGQ
jgi:NADPH2:quinone reductase